MFDKNKFSINVPKDAFSWMLCRLLCLYVCECYRLRRPCRLIFWRQLPVHKIASFNFVSRKCQKNHSLNRRRCLERNTVPASGNGRVRQRHLPIEQRLSWNFYLWFYFSVLRIFESVFCVREVRTQGSRKRICH